MNNNLQNQSEESFEKDLEHAVVSQTNSDLRKKYERKLKEEYGVVKGGNSKRRIYLTIALILALVIAGLYIYQNQGSSKLEPHMYATNIVTDLKVKDNPAWDMRGVTSEQDALLIEAYRDVKEGKYQSALDKYDELSEALEADSEYYRGMAFLKLRKFDDAQAVFSEISEKDNALREQPQWLLAVAYVADEDYEKATKQLQEIINNKEYNWSLASDLLNSILNQ